MKIKKQLLVKSIIVGMGLLFFGIFFNTIIGEDTFNAKGTIYVDDDSICPGNGTIMWPYCKIQYAIDNATATDTIYVFNGTYNENVIINKQLNVTGEDKYSTIIDGGGSGDTVYIDAHSVRLQEFTIKNSGSGGGESGLIVNANRFYTLINDNIISNNLNIGMNIGGKYLTIENNTITQNDGVGVYLGGSESDLYYNYIHDNGGHGIHISGTLHLFQYNNVTYNDAYGITVGGNSNDILNNNVTHNYNGISTSADYNDFYFNTINYNLNTGIFVTPAADYNTFHNNTVTYNGGHAVHLESETHTFTGNNITTTGSNYGIYYDTWLASPLDNIIYPGNKVNGKEVILISNIHTPLTIEGIQSIYPTTNYATNYGLFTLKSCSNIRIKDCEIGNNHRHGIFIMSASNCIIENSTITRNGNDGIFTDAWGTSDNNIFSNNSLIYNNEIGICYYGTHVGNDFYNNNITNNTGDGIYFSGTDFEIYSNDISFNNFGISISGTANDDIIHHNRISNNRQQGVIFWGGGTKDNINFSYNHFINNVNCGIALAYDNHKVFNNTIEFNSGDGLVIYGNSHHVFKNTIYYNSWDGINVGDGHDCIIEKNDITRNNHGIKLYGGGGINTISNNYIFMNDFSGIQIGFLTNSNICYNVLSNNTQCGIDGGSSNNIHNNTIANNTLHGINLADNNDIHTNTIEHNNQYGIRINGYNDNEIYNNILNNTNNCYDTGNNKWNRSKDCSMGPNIIGGPCWGGNYWSDYTGKDITCDGLGDTLVPHACGDWLPLTEVGCAVYNLNTGEGFEKIQYAIDDVDTLDGHVIYATTGTYNENVVVDKQLTIRGENQTNTIIDGNLAGDVVYVNADYVTIDNFTIQNSGSGGNDEGAYIQNIHCTLSNCTIIDNRVGVGTVVGYVTIDNCTVSDNTGDGIAILNNNIVKYCTISYNGYTGLHCDGSNTIYKCFIDHNSVYGLSMAFSGNTIQNNSFYYNGNDNIYGGWDHEIIGNIIVGSSANGIAMIGISTIKENSITSNSGNGIYVGPWAACNGNTIENNSIYDNVQNGIKIHNEATSDPVMDNVIRNNSIYSNGVYGIDLWSDTINNDIYNNILNNSMNCRDSGTNLWNIPKDCSKGPNIIGGDCWGGNNWSDYPGTDVDGDGLGDTIVPHACGDYLPLTEPRIIDIGINESNINNGDIRYVGDDTLSVNVKNLGNKPTTVSVNFILEIENLSMPSGWEEVDSGTNGPYDLDPDVWIESFFDVYYEYEGEYRATFSLDISFQGTLVSPDNDTSNNEHQAEFTVERHPVLMEDADDGDWEWHVVYTDSISIHINFTETDHSPLLNQSDQPKTVYLEYNNSSAWIEVANDTLDDPNNLNTTLNFSFTVGPGENMDELPGTYPIRFRFDGDNRYLPTTETGLLEVINNPPVAGFTYLPIVPTTSEIVQFTDISTDIEEPIATWYWDFGDGNYSTNQHPTHQYTNPTIYTICLEVTDTNGATNTTCQDIIIIELDLNQDVMGDRGFPIRHAPDGDWGGAQSFIPTMNSIAKAEIFMRKFGTPAFDLTVELRTDHPQGILVDTVILSPGSVSSSWEWLEIDFTDAVITPGLQYFIVCPPAPSGVPNSFGYEWRYAFGNQYDDGAFWFTRDGGGLWRDLPTMYEFVFKTYGYN